jgi:hypothetical protein
VNDSVVHGSFSSNATSEPTASIAENARLMRVESEVLAASARSNSRASRPNPYAAAEPKNSSPDGSDGAYSHTPMPRIVADQPAFELISDPDGDIADRFGIRIWPTIVAVDGGGIVTGVRQGLYEFDKPAPVSGQEHRLAVDSPASNGDAS